MIGQSERCLLARIGFFLCREGLIPEAEAVFEGLRVSDPAKNGPVVGLALCRVIKGECDEAVKLIDERLSAGCLLFETMALYKLVALGMGGRLSDAATLRGWMEAQGMTGSLAIADTLLEELRRLKSA